MLQGPLITVLGVAYATAGRSERADAMFLTIFRRSLVAIEDLEPFALLLAKRRQSSAQVRA